MMGIEAVQKITETKGRHRGLCAANAVRQTLCVLLMGSFLAGATLAAAAQDGASTNGTGPKLGPVTNLPLPRFVSMKAAEGNVRRGPSLNHRIDWVFKRRGMPLEVTAEYGHWRRVQDRDGQGGWVHYALLSGIRTVLIEEDMLQVRARPQEGAPVVAAFELGVVAQLGACDPSWCEVTAGGHTGWTRKENLWGVDADELRE
ncbi:SH3 domain-containing protein [Tritonibacter sp. AK171]|uniref:SH3 domain-containing protein n=1 Tax=Tritonibacter sp. AK171 TaxID=3048493 RepID=UPI0024C28BB9|nr:SH3 domain-containing protein [Tritonibacter sp. AK171]